MTISRELSHNSFIAIGYHKGRSPPYGPAPQGSHLITLHSPSLASALSPAPTPTSAPAPAHAPAEQKH